MSKILKVIDNETIEISEYRNPRLVFNNKEYDDFENFCIFKEVIRPFQMFVENEDLKQRIDKAIEYIEKRTKETDFDNDKLIDILDILKGSDSNE